MSDTNTDPTPQEETITHTQIASFCRHLGRSLRGVGESDTGVAIGLMREAEYLEKNGFPTVSTMFAMVANTLDPNVPLPSRKEED